MFELAIIGGLIAFIVKQCSQLKPEYSLSNGMIWRDDDNEKKAPENDSLMFKKGGSAPSPDPQIGKAALENAALGREWLGFAREQFASANRRQEDIDELADRLGEQQFAAGERAMEWSQEDRDRYKDKFLPLEDEFIQQAREWGGEAEQEKVAAEARADVMKSADMQRQMTQRNLSRMGIDPRSGRYAAVEKAGDVSTQLAAAGAVNRARDIRRKEGMAMKSDAINLGRGLPSQAISGAGLGLNAGNSALGANLNAAQNQRANTSIMNQGFQGAISGNASSANILTGLHGAQMNQWQANQAARQAPTNSLMQAIGTGIGAYAGLKG